MTLPARLDVDVYRAYRAELLRRPGLQLADYLAELEERRRPRESSGTNHVPDGEGPRKGPARRRGRKQARPRVRTEIRSQGGRVGAVRVWRPDLGHEFRSLAEERRYELLVARADVVHVDLEPLFRFPSGNTYRADFMTWLIAGTEADGDPVILPGWVEDVKGRRKLETAFLRARREFDAWHPLAPLRVVYSPDQGQTWEGL